MQDARFVRKAFDGIAGRYVLTNHVLSMGIDILWRRATASLVADWSPKWVLDLATGSGDLAATIQRVCPEAKVLGGDFCPPMMEHAKQRGLESLVAADGMCLPFRDGSWDVVTVAFGLRNMASWPQALREMARVIKPTGRLVVLDFSLPRSRWFRSAYVWYLERVMPKVAGLITGKRDAYEYLCKSIERFPSGEAMVNLMMENGFHSAHARPLSGGIATLYWAIK
ncbi:MAG: ubiquinone/menaquinone biosynthesis methyltransferase [Verrucomicrobiaceae bacterium]|nr:ubiquinone/menaquinone biosynthesis methyltransferase [Verrucomicrobiaceae bacterium]